MAEILDGHPSPILNVTGYVTHSYQPCSSNWKQFAKIPTNQPIKQQGISNTLYILHSTFNLHLVELSMSVNNVLLNGVKETWKKFAPQTNKPAQQPSEVKRLGSMGSIPTVSYQRLMAPDASLISTAKANKNRSGFSLLSNIS